MYYVLNFLSAIVAYHCLCYIWRKPSPAQSRNYHEEWRMIDDLRDTEGNSVTIHCDNGLSNCCITVNGYYTGYVDREYRADRIIDCLELACDDQNNYDMEH